MANKAIPDRLKDFMVYKNGTTDLVGVADIQLPSFSFGTEEVKGAGVFGSFETSVGSFGSQKITLNWHSITDRLFDFLELGAHRLDCRGALQEHDRGSGRLITRALRIVVQGSTTSGELGKLEKGTTTDSSTELEITYIKIDMDGKNVLELDKLNYIYRVNGKDQLADTRRALGL